MDCSNILPPGEPASLGILPDRLERLHQRIQQFVDDGQHAGISLLLVRNGQIADTFATGFRNRELSLPMSRDTIVRVYSMTKIVVSVRSLRPDALQRRNWQERESSDVAWELMIANHLTGLAVPFHNLSVGEGFGLVVAVRLDNGLAGRLGTIGSFGWAGMATTYCWIDPREKLVALCFAQHLPSDEHGLFHRFTNLFYQALA
jgi:CubicO group peptidase (beta-lactamase class C family)